MTIVDFPSSNVDIIHFQIKDAILFADDIAKTKLYRDVKKVADSYSGIDDEDEAVELSWDEKRFALKQFLKTNRDILEPKLFENEQDSSDTSEESE